jgi:hypothetical protein
MRDVARYPVLDIRSISRIVNARSRYGLLHGYYTRRAGLTQHATTDVRFVFEKWSGARDLNPGPHGPEI